MTITIGTVTFDHVAYDAEGDVLYLSVGEPRQAADSYGTSRDTMCATTSRDRAMAA
jgi:hypothetical protein